MELKLTLKVSEQHMICVIVEGNCFIILAISQLLE